MVDPHTMVDSPANRKLEIIGPTHHPDFNRKISMLVDFDAVKAFSAARGCKVKRLSKVSCEITGTITATCNASDKEGRRWNVLDVFRACHRARVAGDGLERVGSIEPPKGLDTKSHGYQEDVIAEALRADGIWPYKSGRRTAALEALLASEARDGFIPTADVNRRIKLAARAVVDAGLANHFVGPRRGMYLCIRWTPAARQTALTADEEDGISVFSEKSARQVKRFKVT
jgi:hypothetical protein